MTRTERRLLIDTGIVGVILTCIVAALEWGGLLSAPEHFFYDQRAQRCQYFQPPPTDKLVHLDIDDRTLAEVGAWPWPRSRLAEIIDEISLAGAGALDLDIIFPEPQPPEYEPIPADQRGPADATTTRPGGAAIVRLRRVDQDAALAAAIQRCGRVLVPVNLELKFKQSQDPLLHPLVAELMQDLELKPQQLLERLQARGLASSASLADIDGWLYTAASREAMFQRISGELLAHPGLSDAGLRRKLLPQTDPQLTDSPLLRLLRAQRARYDAYLALRRFGRPIPQGIPPLLSTNTEESGVASIMRAAACTGFVDYVPLGTDGIVRSVPLWASDRNLMYPQMGLALACAMLGVAPQDLRITSTRITIPAASGDIAIPVRTQSTGSGPVGMFFDIPWFGGENWETMYDYPRHKKSAQHLPLSYVWEACQLRHRIRANNASADQALVFILAEIALDKAQALIARPPGPDDSDTRGALIEWTLDKLKKDGTVEFYQAMKPEDLPSAEDRIKREKILSSPQALQRIRAQNQQLKAELNKRGEDLRARLGGRAVLVGWTAAGAIADVVPTPLYARCPGVVIHGAIFNAIMTRHFWRSAPAWVNLLITLLMGLLGTAMVAWLPPWKAFSGMLALIAGYLVFNGEYLFDKRGLLVGVAGPVTAAVVVWAFGTLIHYILERSLRKRIRRNFETYVDEKLVRYLLDHDARLDGQVRELTVVFTDLAGFTTISEQLAERTVPLLNEYMGLMVPIIKQCNGTLNKFLGDGIMFFFGAPFENAAHSYDAVRCVLAMQQAMGPFNQSLAQRGLPQLGLRAGISSGNMIVGNAGPADRSANDYTVLGDVVNLGARLEPANKVFGSRILVNARTRELAGDDRILFRPIARIQAVGKSEGVMTHEPLCLIERADEGMKKLAQMTADIVNAFMGGDFRRCLAGIDDFEHVFERSKLTTLYRELCDNYLKTPPPADFDGRILQTAK